VIEELLRIGRRFDARGWVLGTSGNFSMVLVRDPLRIGITRSGAQKGELTPEDILTIDGDARVVGGQGVPSAETLLHVEIVRARGAGAVMHTHSIWSTVLSGRHGDPGGIEITGYEMLKGLDGIATHEHREWLPILENDQDMVRLAAEVRKLLGAHPKCHGFLLRRHGLYTWGKTPAEAVRHVEILEFLLESLGREKEAAWR
jgi:methylthioribulose-1-phosphate dehydratase